jgi:hypothetical protein
MNSQSGAVPLKYGVCCLREEAIMKKDISLAVMATILVLQIIGGIFGGAVEKITDKVADQLSNRIQIEQMLSGG